MPPDPFTGAKICWELSSLNRRSSSNGTETVVKLFPLPVRIEKKQERLIFL